MPKRSACCDIDEGLAPRRKRCRLSIASEKENLKIVDLPADCLLSIFSEINIWHHNRLRATCRYFRDIHDMYLKHEFQKALHNFTKNNRKNYATGILYSIKKATEIYAKEGYESILYDCLQPLLRKAYRTPFDLENQNIKHFLAQFYQNVNKYADKESAHRSLILYMMTMLNLLKSFRDHELNATESNNCFSIKVIIPSIWMGTLFHGRSLRNHDKCHALLVILSLVLIGSNTSQAFKYVHEFEGDIFLFGTDASNIQDIKTEFLISIKGNAIVRAFFRKWLNGNTQIDEDGRYIMPNNLETKSFEFDVRINCKSVAHWGCPQTRIWHIMPKA